MSTNQIELNRHISLLRGINVSGRKKIKMPALRALYESLGWQNVASYLQSGNLLFDCEEVDAGILVTQIQSLIKDHYNFDVPVIMRTPADIRRIIENNPFLAQGEEITKLYVTFLGEPPTAEQLDALEMPANISDEMSVGEQELFIFCPDGYARTKLNNNFFERKLKMPATTRNWRTINKIFQIATK